MAQDWLEDVRRYQPNADPDAVAGVVRYCGIALRNRDSSLVSFGDPDERGRVRERFLRKKLQLGHSDAELDSAIADVGETMRADRTKNRVTVYYLLAERFNCLPMFVSAKAAAARAAGKGPVAAADKPETPVAAAARPQPDARPAAVPTASNDRGTGGEAAQPDRTYAAQSGARPLDTASGHAEPATPATNWWLVLIFILVVVVVLYLLFS